MNIEITSDEQSYVIVTEVGNGAYSAYVPADFGTFTYTASGQHYAPLSQTAEVKGEEMNLTVSYAAYRRITLSVPAFDYSTGNQLTLKLFGQSNDATESQVSFTQTLYDGELETYNVVPQGTYSCRAEDVSAETYTPVRVALQNVTVGESDASVSLDLNASVLLSTDFTDITDTLGVSFYILPEGCTTASEAIGVNGRSSISLSAGKYYLYGNLNGLDGYSYSFNRTIDLTTPVSLRLERADFHKVQLAFEGLNVEVPIVTVEHAGCEGLFGATFSDNSYFLGDFTYAIRAVWIDDYSYAMPYAYSGRVSVSTADVTTKADLSNMRAFKARLKYGDASAIIFTDASGATGELTFLTEDMGILLPVGTYSITSWLSPLYCTISVPDDCPEYIDFIYSFKPTGIHSTAQAQGLTARAEAGGLRMVAPQGGRVSVSVFDLSGRRVITGQAADGEVVSTAALTPGVYVARLTAGNAAATVKFTVH